jgi:hypothetical protein
MDEFATWLENEIAVAERQWQRASNDLARESLTLAGRALSQYQKDYWGGYADALTNALNEYNGPGAID